MPWTDRHSGFQNVLMKLLRGICNFVIKFETMQTIEKTLFANRKTEKMLQAINQIPLNSP
jgi:hypothetical protein